MSADYESDVVALDPGLDDLVDQLEVDPQILGGMVDDLATLLGKPEFDESQTARETLARLARGIADSYGDNSRRLHRLRAYQLSMAWRRRAAMLGDLDSLLDLARWEADAIKGRAVDPKSDNGGTPISCEGWMPKAFSAVLDGFGRLDGYPAQREEKTKRLLGMSRDLIRWKNSQSPSEASEWLARLVKVLARDCLLDVASGELGEIRKEIESDSPGIWVLDGIEPSGDKYVKATLGQYNSLCEMPTPLAPVPDLRRIKTALEDEFPWFADVTGWLLRQLAVRSAGSLGFKIPPLLLLGPPGVGKTSYLQRLAELSALPFLSLSLAGKNDNRDLAGTARGWGTGHPSRVIALIKQHRIANPVILLDEIDKTGGSDHNGRITDTLLTLLEPASSARFYDDFLWGHADLSRVSWIATANSVATLPEALLGRLEVKRVGHPSPKDYPAIILRSVDCYLKSEGLDPAWIPAITPDEWQWLSRYCKTPRLARRAAQMLVNHKLTVCCGGSA